MEKQFVTYEIALKLKELGFDEECFGIFVQEKDNLLVTVDNTYYTGCTLLKHIKAPLWQQVVDWFDSKNIYIQIRNASRDLLEWDYAVYQDWNSLCDELLVKSFTSDRRTYSSRQEALEQAILKAIGLCQKE